MCPHSGQMKAMSAMVGTRGQESQTPALDSDARDASGPPRIHCGARPDAPNLSVSHASMHQELDRPDLRLRPTNVLRILAVARAVAERE